MNFNDLYKKIAAIENGQLGETCGSMMGGDSYKPPPQSDSVNMNVNMSGSGQGGIRDLLNILKDIDRRDVPIDMHGHDKDHDDVLSIMKLAGKKTMMPGNDGLEEPRDDMRIDFDKRSEEFANEPDEKYSDVSAITHDVAGGLNAPHKQFKKEYPGDNPMAENLRHKLTAKYQTYK